MLTQEDKELLLDTARSSIEYGLEHGNALPINSGDYPQNMQEHRATFVTLKINNELRGCIGTLEAMQPLIEDVAEHAYAAAFRDPRFPPLSTPEFENLEYHISILSEPEPLTFSNEEDLLKKIRPGIDGLIIEEGTKHGTFLPSVWESLPASDSFLRNLKQKAGLPADYWSDTIKLQRYTVEEF